MRKLLDKMFENKRLSIVIPILSSLLLYLLFIFWGMVEDKVNIIIATPIASVFCFFGVFLVVYIQVRNKRCPDAFINFFELLATVAFSIFSVAEAISFIISGFQNFSPLTCAGLLTYAAVSWAHSKRI